ncbi:MAG: PKD domain-containing protein [Thermoplasmata archaeon]|nr:PKD domain-containing protein [Thermoplasmata archaeon]
MKKALVIILAVLLGMPFIASVESKDIYVNEGESIQDAIDSAMPGDVIHINRGVYRENIIINKEISIIGDDATIDGMQNFTIKIEAKNVIIEGLEIINSTCGILISGNATIYECTIENNHYGIISEGNGSHIFHNNFISNYVNAVDHGMNNTWYYNGKGNYWDDYTGKDEDNDGIGDTPYNISQSSADKYPLMYMYGIPHADFDFIINGKNVEFYAHAMDYESGIVNYTWHFGDGGIAYGRNVTHNYSVEGIYNVCLYVENGIGKNATSCKNVIIDCSPPYTMLVSNPPSPNGWNEWYISNVEITLMAFDNLSGIKKIRYSIDGSTWGTYDGKITLGEGKHRVEFYSIDNAGNVESNKLKKIKIDTTPPTTSAHIWVNSTNGWYNERVNISLISTDGLSGVNSTYYYINGILNTYSGGNITIGEGMHDFSYFSIDNAGNGEKPSYMDINVDITPPTAKIVSPSPGIYIMGRKLIDYTQCIIIGNISIEAYAMDSLSGIWHVDFYIDNELMNNDSTAPYTWMWDERAIGPHTIGIIAYDNAANCAEYKEDVIIFNI